MTSARTTTKKPRARPISQVEWDDYQQDIEELYVNQGKSLEKVAAVLHKRHGFDPQKCQYKAQIARWGFKKNTCRKDRSWVEYDLSMRPSKEQREHWISDHWKALLPLHHLGYRPTLKKLVLLYAADEMFLDGKFDLFEYLQSTTIAFKEPPHILGQISGHSPTGWILSDARLDYDSWISVLFCSAKIASVMSAKDLTIPVCATPEHRCCPMPTWGEKRFSPQCQQLFKQSTMILLLGLLFASEAGLVLGGSSDGYILRSALSSVERQLPTAMKHAKRLNQKCERRISESGMYIEDQFQKWYGCLVDSVDEVLDRGVCMIP